MYYDTNADNKSNIYTVFFFFLFLFLFSSWSFSFNLRSSSESRPSLSLSLWVASSPSSSSSSLSMSGAFFRFDGVLWTEIYTVCIQNVNKCKQNVSKT